MSISHLSGFDTTGTAAALGRVRPALRPALRVLRRDRLTLQVGTDPQRAVAYAVTDPVLIDLVCAFDGRRTVAELARSHGAPVAVVSGLVAELFAAGLAEDAGRTPFTACCRAGHPGCVEDHPATGGRARLRRQQVLDGMRRLGPDLAAWDLLEATGDGGRAEWERRVAATVHVAGSGRVGLAVGLLLGAAGIGQVVAGDDEQARQADRGALALAGADVGGTRREGLRRRLGEVAPATKLLGAGGPPGACGPPGSGEPAGAGGPAESGGRPDLVVLASETAPDRALAAELSRRGIAHLVVTVTETVAVLGPFVQPGRTACVRCLDLHRTDRDPAWPLVLDRLAHGTTAGSRPGGRSGSPTPVGPTSGSGAAPSGPAVAGCDDVLATLAAAHAVLHCTTALRGDLPPSADATWEFRLPGGQARRRTWEPHPDCGCDWATRPTGVAAREDNGRRERAAP